MALLAVRTLKRLALLITPWHTNGYRYDAKAIGSGSEGAQAELQNEYHKVRQTAKG